MLCMMCVSVICLLRMTLFIWLEEEQENQEEYMVIWEHRTYSILTQLWLPALLSLRHCERNEGQLTHHMSSIKSSLSLPIDFTCELGTPMVLKIACWQYFQVGIPATALYYSMKQFKQEYTKWQWMPTVNRDMCVGSWTGLSSTEDFLFKPIKHWMRLENVR